MLTTFIALALAAQSTSQDTMPNPMPAPTPVAASRAGGARVVPASTMLVVTPTTEISSKHVEVGNEFTFTTVNDVVENGVVAIQRGAPVKGVIKWKTGRAIGGKSGKFEVEFKTISVNGRDYAVRGLHRQEGRGNTVGALLGSIIISGRSAVMIPGQTVNIFTVDPVAF